MKLTKFALATAICSGLFVTGAFADGLRQPGSVQPAAHNYNYYAQDEAPAAPSPSDLEPPTMAGDLVSSSYKDGDGSKGHDGCDVKGGKGKGGHDPCEPWRLFGDYNGWQLTGHLAVGATYNADNPPSHYNGPVTFNDRDEFQGNQAYLSFGKDTDTGGCGWDIGGRIDVLYGSDYIFTQSAGLETETDFAPRWNGLTASGQFNHYGVALPQAYVDVAYNNLTARIGHFYTIMGYEVVPAPGNFFYSHAYTMQYGEPFTHTGGLLTYDYNNWTLMGGVVNGWDKFDAVSDRMAFLGGVTYTPCHERYTATLTFITGEEDGALAATTPTTVRSGYSFVFNYNVTDNLNYVLQHDNFWQEDTGTTGDDSQWYGLNNYLFYTINDCWKAGVRAEWFRDDDGVRLIAAPIRGGGSALTGLTQDQVAGNYYEVALGLNWMPTANITVRPEVRWDWSDDTAVAPYDDLTKDSQFLAAFDAILLF